MSARVAAAGSAALISSQPGHPGQGGVGVIAEVGRNERTQPDPSRRGQRRDQLQNVQLSSGHRSTQRARVDVHRQTVHRPPRGGERARERPGRRQPRRGDRLPVVRVSLVDDRLVRPLRGMGQAIGREAGPAVMTHEHLIGGDVRKRHLQAALREVDLLAVAGREGEIEVSDEIQRATADVHAVTARRHERGPQAQSAGADGGSSGLKIPVGRGGDQTHPRLRHREVAAVVRQRAGRGDLAVAARRRAQPVEPPGGNDAVRVQDDDVRGRRAGKRAVDVRREADVALAAQVEQCVAVGRSAGIRGAIPEAGDPRARALVGAGVVADEDRHLARRVLEHAAKALGEMVVSTVDGDTDDHVATADAEASVGFDPLDLHPPIMPSGPC